jgi:hypothetical protein
MLDRTRRNRTVSAELRRARWAKAKRQQRQRERAGSMTVAIEISGELIDMLVRWQWLDRHHDGDKLAIASAIERMLAASERLELRAR